MRTNDEGCERLDQTTSGMSSHASIRFLASLLLRKCDNAQITGVHSDSLWKPLVFHEPENLLCIWKQHWRMVFLPTVKFQFWPLLKNFITLHLIMKSQGASRNCRGPTGKHSWREVAYYSRQPFKSPVSQASASTESQEGFSILLIVQSPCFKCYNLNFKFRTLTLLSYLTITVRNGRTLCNLRLDTMQESQGPTVARLCSVLFTDVHVKVSFDLSNMLAELFHAQGATQLENQWWHWIASQIMSMREKKFFFHDGNRISTSLLRATSPFAP